MGYAAGMSSYRSAQLNNRRRIRVGPQYRTIDNSGIVRSLIHSSPPVTVASGECVAWALGTCVPVTRILRCA